MAVKRNSPLNGRSPSMILPIVDAKDSSATLPLLSKIPRPSTANRLPRGAMLKELGVLHNMIPVDLAIAIAIWYMVGVGSICTTKMLLMPEYALPPLVLTFQQLLLGSTLIRLYLGMTGGVQALPKESQQSAYSIYFDFVLMGLFNALDFLASNTCFSHSAASFVETVKASEPLTTTAIALFFGIDQLRFPEAMSMVVLIAGVYLSTLGNTDGDDGSSLANSEAAQELTMHESVKTAVIVMTANICFAL